MLTIAQRAKCWDKSLGELTAAELRYVGAAKDELHIGLAVPKQAATEIYNWVQDQDWPEGTELEPLEDYHITLLFAQGGGSIDHNEDDWIEHDRHAVSIDGIKAFPPSEEKNGLLPIVLLIKGDGLQEHHDLLADGAEGADVEISQYSRDKYQPHMTIAYGPGLPEGLEPPDITFETEPSTVSTPREEESKTSRVGSPYDFDQVEPSTQDYMFGQCAAYADALHHLKPDLRLGIHWQDDYEDDNGEEYEKMQTPQHYFTHDNDYAYDAMGKHPLPYEDWDRDTYDHDWDELEHYGMHEGGYVDPAIRHAEENDVFNKDAPSLPRLYWSRLPLFRGQRLAGVPEYAEHVPIEAIMPYKEFDRRPGAAEGISADPEYWDRLKSHIAEHGFEDPLTLEYEPTTNTARLGEGNHRLQMAQELGMSHVPVHVMKTSAPGVAQLQTQRQVEPDQFDYFPSALRPSELGLPVSDEPYVPAPSREPTSWYPTMYPKQANSLKVQEVDPGQLLRMTPRASRKVRPVIYDRPSETIYLGPHQGHHGDIEQALDQQHYETYQRPDARGYGYLYLDAGPTGQYYHFDAEAPQGEGAMIAQALGVPESGTESWRFGRFQAPYMSELVRFASDSWDLGSQWPGHNEGEIGKDPRCTCEQDKLSCPVHGMEATEPSYEHMWNFEDLGPAHKDGELPRTWLRAQAKETAPQQIRRWEDLKPHPSSGRSEIVHQWPDGWTVQNHPTQLAVQAVGQMMNNCWQGKHPTTDEQGNLISSGRPGIDAIQHFMAIHDENDLPRVAFYVNEFPSKRYEKGKGFLPGEYNGRGESKIRSPWGPRNKRISDGEAERLQSFARDHGISDRFKIPGELPPIDEPVPAQIGEPEPIGARLGVEGWTIHESPDDDDLEEWGSKRDWAGRRPFVIHVPTKQIAVGPSNTGHVQLEPMLADLLGPAPFDEDGGNSWIWQPEVAHGVINTPESPRPGVSLFATSPGFDLHNAVEALGQRYNAPVENAKWTFGKNAAIKIHELDPRGELGTHDMTEEEWKANGNNASADQTKPFIYVPSHQTIYLGNPGWYHDDITDGVFGMVRTKPIPPCVPGRIYPDGGVHAYGTDLDTEQTLLNALGGQAWDPTKWTFSRVADREHQLAWTSGNEGKGVIFDDGRIHTWNIDPNHPDVTHGEDPELGIRGPHHGEYVWDVDPEAYRTNAFSGFDIDPAGSLDGDLTSEHRRHIQGVLGIESSPSRWKFGADEFDTREYSDAVQFPPQIEPLKAAPQMLNRGCTCKDGEKLTCPVHGLEPTIEDPGLSWSIPEGHPVGYDSPQQQGPYIKAQGASQSFPGIKFVEYGPRATPEQILADENERKEESWLKRRPFIYDQGENTVHIGKPGTHHGELFQYLSPDAREGEGIEWTHMPSKYTETPENHSFVEWHERPEDGADDILRAISEHTGYPVNTHWKFSAVGDSGLEEEIFKLIAQSPGITIPEMAAQLGVKQNNLYRLVPTMEQRALIVKPHGQRGYSTLEHAWGESYPSTSEQSPRIFGEGWNEPHKIGLPNHEQPWGEWMEPKYGATMPIW